MGDWGGVTAYLKPGSHARAVGNGQRVTLPMAAAADKRSLDVSGGDALNGGGGRETVDASLNPQMEADAFKEIVRRLLELRKEIAPTRVGTVFGERGAKAIATALPMSNRQLARIEGIGAGKAGKWGDRVLALLRDCVRSFPHLGARAAQRSDEAAVEDEEAELEAVAVAAEKAAAAKRSKEAPIDVDADFTAFRGGGGGAPSGRMSRGGGAGGGSGAAVGVAAAACPYTSGWFDGSSAAKRSRNEAACGGAGASCYGSRGGAHSVSMRAAAAAGVRNPAAAMYDDLDDDALAQLPEPPYHPQHQQYPPPQQQQQPQQFSDQPRHQQQQYQPPQQQQQQFAPPSVHVPQGAPLGAPAATASVSSGYPPPQPTAGSFRPPLQPMQQSASPIQPSAHRQAPKPIQQPSPRPQPPHPNERQQQPPAKSPPTQPSFAWASSAVVAAQPETLAAAAAGVSGTQPVAGGVPLGMSQQGVAVTQGGEAGLPQKSRLSTKNRKGGAGMRLG